LPPLAHEQLEALSAAIRSRPDLQAIQAEIERLHQVVFHADRHADWALVQRSAHQILISEIVYRYGGSVEGLSANLRSIEQAGKPRAAAVRELAAAIHSYYTTPLGMVMRQDLFGPHTVFITPDAYEWTAQLRGRGQASQGGQP